MKPKKIFTLVLLSTLVFSAGFGCKQNVLNKEQFKPITLEYWGVWDTPEQMSKVISAYQATHPTIKVNYRNFRYDEYEAKLLAAAWDNRVPDIFMIPSTDLKKYQAKLSSMPKVVKIPITQIQGTIKKEAITTLQTVNSLSLQDVKEKFVQVVNDDVVVDNKIYGLPYSVDTLVTFYNSDLLTKAGIPEPMKDLDELVEQVEKSGLAKIGTNNQIYQAGVALGGADNIPRFFDILSALWMENDVKMQGNDFNPLQDKTSAQRFADVLTFYTYFADPTKAVYSWTADLPNAFELFAQGKLAYFFGYSYHADELRKRGLQFNWDLENFPQTRGAEGTKYYANYWLNVVAKNSANQDAAWNFVQSVTTDPGLVSQYLEPNNKPTALRALVKKQLENDQVRVFASQVLTADNWYAGYNATLAETYLAEFIKSYFKKEIQLDAKGLDFLVKRLNQTYSKPNE